jgi:hypothetical protein
MGTMSSAKQRPPSRVPGTERDGDAWELSKSQVRELQRRVRDLDDRTRYLLVSVFTPRMVLYYNVSNDMFGMNDPSLGTLFKRRAAAIAIQRLLRTGIQLIQCRADRHDRVVRSSLPRLRPIRRLLPVGGRGDSSRSRHA